MNIPERVYHYTTMRTALDHILPSHSLKLGSLGDTNDPRETKGWSMPILFVSGELPQPDNSREGSRRYFEAMDQILSVPNRIRREEWWVVCLTCDDDKIHGPSRKGYARPRMWAQYADNHRGICLEIDGLALHQAVLSASNHNPIFHGKVTYIDEEYATQDRERLSRGEAFTLDYTKLSASGFDDAVRGHIRKYHRHYLFGEVRGLEQRDGVSLAHQCAGRTLLRGYQPSASICNRWSRFSTRLWSNSV